MDHLYIINESCPLKENDFPIEVISFMGLQNWTFGVNNKHKIKDLKNSLTKYLKADFYEIFITIGPEYPYSLKDDMYLHELLEHHRKLHTIVAENPKKVVPSRLVTYNDCKKIIDLRQMRHDDLQNLSYNWIVSYSFDSAYSIFLSSIHPFFGETLKEIAKDINSTLNIEERPQYPLHYVVYDVDQIDTFILNNLEALFYFYEKLSHFSNFRRIRLYINENNENKLVTKDLIKDISQALYEKMWDY